MSLSILATICHLWHPLHCSQSHSKRLVSVYQQQIMPLGCICSCHWCHYVLRSTVVVHLRVFSWRTTHPVALISIAKILNRKVAKRPKCFFFFFSFSDGLVQICMTLSWWFLHETAAVSTEQCTSPSLFSRFEVSRGGSNRSLKNYSFLCDAIFSSCVRMHTSHLAMKCNYYARLLN